MKRVILNSNLGFGWFNYENRIYVKGYIYDKDNRLLSNGDFAEYVNKFDDSFSTLISKAKELYGAFSIVINLNDELYLIADRISTFHLFYSVIENDVIISDSLYEIQKLNKSQIIPFSLDEFESNGYVSGSETLFENTFQLRAGEIVKISDNKIENKLYFHFKVKIKTDNDIDYYRDEYVNVLRNMTERLIKGADGRTLLIALSSGYDSRLIASLLRYYNYENVVCFTYGRIDSYEIPLAKKVAEKLNYKWHYVEYSESFLQGFTKDKLFYKFVEYSSNLNSTPHIQDYFAVKYLLESELINQDMIICLGTVGPYYHNYESSYKKFLVSNNFKNALNLILHLDFQYKRIENRLELLEKIEKLSFDYNSALEKFDNWQYKEQQPKFILNALRAFEFLGFGHRTPILDYGMIDFFNNLPIEFKIGDNLYKSESMRTIFNKTGVDFTPTAYPHLRNNKLINNFIKTKLSRIITSTFGNLFMKKYSDVNNFSYIIKELIPNAIQNKGMEIFYNGNITKWYLDNFVLKQKF